MEEGIDGVVVQYYSAALYPDSKPDDDQAEAFEWAAYDDFASRAEIPGEAGEEGGLRSAKRAAARSPRDGGESPQAKRRR